MKVAILVENLYDEREFIYPYYRLQEANYEVVVVGPKSEIYRSKMGLEVKADIGAEAIKAEDLDALVIPGGYAPDRLRRYSRILELVRRMDELGKPIGAICHAGWVLISAGIVSGRRLTGYYSIKDDLINAGAVYLDEPLVVDRNLVTSRGPYDLKFWVKGIINVLERKD
ncbi:MAG: type 1 glutamine amidotransferase [Thermotogae bacterium]|nr:type 1 glutamine amidotransferase [Thermotogota bacterium]